MAEAPALAGSAGGQGPASAPWSAAARLPPLVVARGELAGRLAGLAAEAGGSGEVLLLPSADVAVPRLARAAAPPPFVVAQAGALRVGLGRFLRLLAEPDLISPIVFVGPPNRAPRLAAVARGLGLAAVAVPELADGGALAALLSGLRARPRPDAAPLAAEDLARAIAGGAIVNRYQPQVRLDDGVPVALETLARWEHPLHGLLGAAEFVPMAEQAGLSSALADRVVRQAVADLAALHAAGYAYAVALNLPLEVLLDPGLPEQLAAICAAGGLAAEALTIELTESQIARDLEAVRDAALRLRALRFGVSIDDFTPSEAQAGLVLLPFTEMKLDRSLVVAALADRAHRAALADLVRRAHALGLAVVAEGVETPQAWAVAQEIGADLAQGWMVGRPLPAGAVAAWTAAWGAGVAGLR
ncbi:MAG: EAL domain-containing protein [Elioraea sp.]|nr:EAL domain-containing protein [Elioraea sp.]MDW8444506.1 EAL domain-containing protein [Acetobacteraceae bacterium]